MSRRTSSRSTSSTSSAARKTAPSKPRTPEPVPEKVKSAPLISRKESPASPAVKPAPAPAPPAQAPAAKAADKPAARPAPGKNGDDAADQLLNRAERDITAAIETLNNQMNTALTALAGLASVHAERGKAVVRTAPLDRATATFHRLVAEVVDDQFSEMLPPLIALRAELNQWAAGSPADSAEAEFYRRGVETLDHVLSLAGATSYDARPGQPFDPLIHLAVGESRQAEFADGAVAQCLQPGFRSARGKVLTPARVRINRR